MDKGRHIGALGAPFDQQMNMVGHQAVRNHCDVEQQRGLRNLLEHHLDHVVLNETGTAIGSAKRQEIALNADVVIAIQSRSPVAHAAACGNKQA